MLQDIHPATITEAVSEAELAYAIDTLRSTQKDIHDAVAGLSENQLAAKPDSDRWSIAECMEHIVLVETGVFERLQANMQFPADPAKRADMQVSDLYLTKAVRSRKSGIAAPEYVVPTGRFGTIAATLAAFDEQRNAAIVYAQSDPGDWRTHYFKHLVFGRLDGYQALLLLAAHSERHRKQIEEIKERPGFPQ